MGDQVYEPEIKQADPETNELSDRRDFLRSLGKWSTAAIAAVLLTEEVRSGQASVRVNRGGWLNRRGGGNRVNRRG